MTWRRLFGRWGFVPVVLLALSASASGQDYPTKPIRMVVPYPAGGVVDFVARQIGQKMADSMGQPVVVENRVGAGGTIATEATAKSAPDGYTVLVVFDTHAVNPHVYKNLRYDTFKDLASVSLVAQIPLALMSYRGFAANTVADVVRMAKEKPGALNYGSPSAGTSGHLAAEQFKLLAGVDILHVPYRGGAPLLTALLGEQVPARDRGTNSVPVQHCGRQAQGVRGHRQAALTGAAERSDNDRGRLPGARLRCMDWCCRRGRHAGRGDRAAQQ